MVFPSPLIVLFVEIVFPDCRVIGEVGAFDRFRRIRLCRLGRLGGGLRLFGRLVISLGLDTGRGGYGCCPILKGGDEWVGKWGLDLLNDKMTTTLKICIDLIRFFHLIHMSAHQPLGR